jgi:hypothetical protein
MVCSVFFCVEGNDEFRILGSHSGGYEVISQCVPLKMKEWKMKPARNAHQTWCLLHAENRLPSKGIQCYIPEDLFVLHNPKTFHSPLIYLLQFPDAILSL